MFDLERIRREIRAAPIASPYERDLAAAIVNDCFRLAGKAPAPDRWILEEHAKSLWPEQLGMMAHLLASTSLGRETVAAIGDRPGAKEILDGFRQAIAPLTAEMIRANDFRQEEALRRWIEAFGGGIEGETAEESARRVDQLDYRKALAEYRKVEKTRLAEAARREKLLEEAMDREAVARGWRE